MRVMIEKEVLEIVGGVREVRIHTDVYDVSDFKFVNSRPKDLQVDMTDLESIAVERGEWVKGSVSDYVLYSHLLRDEHEDGDSHIVFIEFYA
jgi:hypothetical protein